ncbi:transcriptional activator domain-containing protein [Micromonospora pallida]|uniref:Transcriptional activator domain-containing protein n=1 Tax=Micromonospora pallida TaxID=145854 RepID=A0A1C6RT42_9ACTN|nr:BTAD domain-containing putative transcriptional regulator [Micromonospora pallida]SCL20363.1 transcriptional activator domain-containing protein [Micromonospora pallida]
MARPSALARATAVTVLVTVVPAILIRVGGDAVPRPSMALLRAWIHQPLTPGFLAVVVLVAAWLVWALLATAVAVRLYVAATRLTRWLPPIHLPRPLQGLTAAVLGASAITTSGVAAHAAPAPATATLHDPAPDAARSASDTRAGDRTVADGSPTHKVRRGESLSTIAAHRLGDRDRWDDIFALNRGTRFPTGGTLTDPDLIRPGWVLDLPASTATRPAPPLAKPPTSAPPATPHDSAPATPRSGNPAGENTSEAPSAPPATSPTTVVTSPTAGSPAAHPMPDLSSAPAPPCGVQVGRSGWIDLGLATAVLAAVALVWAHRRRRYHPRPPTPLLRLDDPSVAPMPPLVTGIRRALRHLAAAATPTTQPGTDPSTPGSEPDRTGLPSDMLHPEQTPSPLTPALTNHLGDMWPPSGLGVTGPGAEAAARGFLVAALAAGGTDEPYERAHVVISSTALSTLLASAATVPDTPRLTITHRQTDAVTLLEEEILHRARWCADHDVDTVAELRDADGLAAPLPPLLVIADVDDVPDERAVSTLLTQGQRLDIHGVLLGAWPNGDTVIVADDGTTRPADGNAHGGGRHLADVGRLNVIDPDDAADLLRVLAESHTGESPPPPADPSPPDSDDHQADDGEPAPADEANPTDDKHPDLDVDDASPHPAPASDGPGRVEVQVLGDARIVDMDTTQPLRGKSLELLVYLAARGGTASQEAILEDLLPDAATSKAPHRLHTYVYNLRRVLKRTGGSTTYLSHPDRRYILHRETVDVDLWRMSDALDQANRATTAADRIAALRRAIDTYQGPLAGDKGYEWIEPYREAVQRQAVDATLALADALHDQPREALAALTTAIGHHPYAEALYQAAMRAHATLGDAAAIRDLHRQLARALDEIDTDVSDDTATLATTLINRLQRGPRLAEQDGAVR